MTGKRVAVFIDWQNIYKTARTAFDLRALSNERGNFNPYELALILAAANGRGPNGGELVKVDVHRGLPSASRDSVGYAANRRQAEAWKKSGSGIVNPRMRPLRYPQSWETDQTPVEKGVDVQLALGAVETVLTSACDVAIIFSHDTDLLPAVETLTRLKGPGSVETASWRSHTFNSRLRRTQGVYHHWISWDVFRLVEDSVNYAYKGNR